MISAKGLAGLYTTPFRAFIFRLLSQLMTASNDVETMISIDHGKPGPGRRAEGSGRKGGPISADKSAHRPDLTGGRSSSNSKLGTGIRDKTFGA